MIGYFCGRPRSGKSLLAEARLRETGGRVLYMGTLPDIVAYRDIIRAHRRRRPAEWELYECVGDPAEDLDRLSRALEEYDGILLDGLAFYLNRALQWGYRPRSREREALEGVFRRAAALPVCLLVVDQPLGELPERTAALGRQCHELLYRYGRELYAVDQGRAVGCTPQFLRGLDEKT